MHGSWLWALSLKAKIENIAASERETIDFYKSACFCFRLLCLFCVSNTSSCLFSFVVVFCFLSVYRHVLSSEVGAQVGVAVGIVAEVAEVEVD